MKDDWWLDGPGPADGHTPDPDSVLASYSPALAIPAFAREYQTKSANYPRCPSLGTIAA